MRVATYILLFFLPCLAVAQGNEAVTVHTKAAGDSLYIKNDFAGAIAVYEQILATEGRAADIYYNIGNAYYKSDDIAKAILNYERALLLAPNDDDIKFNLSLAQTKIVDKVSEPYKIFLAVWVESIINLFAMGTWAVIAIATFILLLLAVLLFLFSNKIGARKTGFIFAILMFVITTFANVAAWHHYDKMTNRTGAIIMQPSVTAKSTPDNSGTDLFVIHEGRKVNITDDTMKGWKEIELEDGTMGWVPATALEKI